MLEEMCVKGSEQRMYYQPYGYPYQPITPMNGSTNNYGGMPHYYTYPYAAMPSNPSQPHATVPGNQSQAVDYGRRPFVVDIEEATKQNNTFRTALWTGQYLQTTLMSLRPGEDIGLEMHPDVDQFIRIEEGQGVTQMGNRKDQLNFRAPVSDDSAIFVPAGAWHNLTNTGSKPLKLYSIYAPPNHPFGTVQPTKAAAMAADYGKHHSSGNTVISGKTPDEWVRYTEYLVNEGLDDVRRGINATHILQEFILMGVLVGQGYTPEKAYETVEEWERTGESKLLQQSKNM